MPLSLSEMDERVTAALTKTVNCPERLQISEQSTLIIDGQALVVTLSKLQNASSFGDLADIFVNYIYASGRYYNRIDVVFADTISYLLNQVLEIEGAVVHPYAGMSRQKMFLYLMIGKVFFLVQTIFRLI